MCSGVVPSVPHELMVELFRNRSEMAGELLPDRAGAPSSRLIAEAASIDFSQVVSTEYRADHVTAYRDPDRNLATELVIITEVQLRVDKRKQRTWPLYVASAAAKFDCDVRLLVVTPDQRVAKWARGPFGTTSFKLYPDVVSFADIPQLVDPAAARLMPELAVLRALAEPSLTNAVEAREIVRLLSSEHYDLYWDVIMSRLSKPDQLVMEEQMNLDYEFQSAYMRRYVRRKVGEGRREGRREGKELGRREGKELGRREGQELGRVVSLEEAALELARVKLGTTSATEESTIRGLRDSAALMALIVALGKAGSPRKARAAIIGSLHRQR